MNQIDMYPATLLFSHKAAQSILKQGTFIARARACVMKYLQKHGPTSSEDLTEVCKAIGILPDPDKDDRQFGHVYQSLSKDKKIAQVPYVDVPRRRGNGTSGGRLWKAVKQ